MNTFCSFKFNHNLTIFDLTLKPTYPALDLTGLEYKDSLSELSESVRSFTSHDSSLMDDFRKGKDNFGTFPRSPQRSPNLLDVNLSPGSLSSLSKPSCSQTRPKPK